MPRSQPVRSRCQLKPRGPPIGLLLLITNSAGGAAFLVLCVSPLPRGVPPDTCLRNTSSCCGQPAVGRLHPWAHTPERRPPRASGRPATRSLGGHQLPLQVARRPQRGSSRLFQLSNCSSDLLEHQPNKLSSSSQAVFPMIWPASPGLGRRGRGLGLGCRNVQAPVEKWAVLGSLGPQ